MDKEQRRRMANRTIVQSDEGQGDIEYTVQVSGDRVELHQQYDHQWDNEDGTGPDISHEVWVMDKDSFKRLLEAGQWCVEKSEAFEATHPKSSHDDEVRDEYARWLSNQREGEEE
jgi:hypothetical protein